MSETLFANADGGVTTGTVVGAASGHAAVLTNDGDTAYIELAPQEEWELRFPDYNGTPPGHVITQVAITYTWRVVGGGNDQGVLQTHSQWISRADVDGGGAGKPTSGAYGTSGSTLDLHPHLGREFVDTDFQGSAVANFKGLKLKNEDSDDASGDTIRITAVNIQIRTVGESSSSVSSESKTRVCPYLDTDPRPPIDVSSVVRGGATGQWTGEFEAVREHNDEGPVTVGDSHYFYMQDFCFDQLPATATIYTFRLFPRYKITKTGGTGNKSFSVQVELLDGNGDPTGVLTNFGHDEHADWYDEEHGLSNISAELTPSEVGSLDFGIRLHVVDNNPSATGTFELDHFELQILYGDSSSSSLSLSSLSSEPMSSESLSSNSLPSASLPSASLPSTSSESLSSESAGSCDVDNLSYDTHGRQGIGVVQPQSGTDFPLVQPSEDVRYLIADLHLALDDPGLYDPDEEPFKPPFRIHWMNGFGCDTPEDGPSCSSSSSSLHDPLCPEPTHDADILIVDDDDRVVFDSTKVFSFASRLWGDRLRVWAWRDDEDAVCMLVTHTHWNPNDDPEPKTFPSVIYPDFAQIDERAIKVLPKRVRSLTVILDNMRRTPVEFHAGYNMLLVPGETTVTDGGRRVTPVEFNATPGEGLGIFPGCEPDTLVLRRINGVGPTPEGDFYMAATDCYYVRQPTAIVSDFPRLSIPHINRPPGNAVDIDLPDPLAGTTKAAAGWPTDDDPIYAHLQIGNNCGPCCDCDDYVAVARYMNRQRNRYHSLGENFEDIRDLYHENRERWLESLECFHRRPLRIFMRPQLCPFLDVVIQFCNQSDECKLDVQLSVTFETSPDGGVGTEVPGYTFISGAKRKEGRRSNETERYQMGGEWPTFTANFEAVNPGSSVDARFRLRFNDCGTAEASGSSSLSSNSSIGVAAGKIPYAVEGCLTGTIEGEPILVSNEEPPPDEREAIDCKEVTLECPPGDGAVASLLDCVACDE